MTKKSLELALLRQEAIRNKIFEIFSLAGVVPDDKTLTAICDLDAMVCMAVGLDPSAYGMTDSTQEIVNHSQTDCRDEQLPLHTS